MPTPAEIQGMNDAFSDYVYQVYAEAEVKMMETVAKRIERGVDTTIPGWAERKLVEVHQLNTALANDTEQLIKLGPDIERAIFRAYDAGMQRSVEEMATHNLASSMAVPEAKGWAIRKMAEAVVGKLEAARLPIIRSVVDVYRSIIVSADVAPQVLAGTMTRRQATQAALSKFAQQGIKSFTDILGRQWDIASYAEMAIRTTTRHASVQGHTDKLVANGHDLVIVSQHPESCPKCDVWESKVLSITGGTPGYPTLEDSRLGGLFHGNCTHTVGLYIDGVTKIPPQVPKDENDQAYQERMEQRKNERAIRMWKRRLATAIEPHEKAFATAKLKEWQQRQRGFIAATGRRRDYSREQVV